MKNSDLKILIVDDHASNIQAVVEVLSDEGYNVKYAENGTEAVNLVKTEDFDLILLDIMMPIMDGYEVCRNLQEDEKSKDIPIIFLTARTDIQSVKKAFSVGGLDYINKPFNIDELLARVKTHLELKTGKDHLKKINEWLEEKVNERTKELKTANEKLLELDNAKTQFLKLISHEIRTPLNGILGGISIIRELGFTEESMTFIDMLDASAKRLEEFSLKALDISSLNMMNNSAIKLQKENINAIIDSVLEEEGERLKKNDINASFLKSKEDIQTKVDKTFFRKCLLNILDNAIRHSPKQSTITIITEDIDSNLVIEIKDKGIGFNKKVDINSIQPFDTLEHFDKNVGLGLYLSNLIVKAHGGTIENGNNKTGGAFIKITLPLL